MKWRKLISFILALFGVFSLVAYEISIKNGAWQSGALIAFIGAGRLYLFYEGTGLNEINEEKAKVAFWLSLLTTAAFAAYVIGMFKVGIVQWDGLLIFLLGTFVLASTEWVLSIRLGEESNSIVKNWMTKANDLESQNGTLQKQINSHHQRITSLESELNGERQRAKSMQEQITELKKQSETGSNLINQKITPERIAGRWVLPCPECIAIGRWNLLATNSNAGKSLTCEDHGLVWEQSNHIHQLSIQDQN